MNKQYISIIFILFFAHNVFSQDTLFKENSVWIGEISNGKRNGYCYEYKNDNLHGEYVVFNWYGKYVWRYGYFENGEKVNWIEYEKGEGPTKEKYLKIKSKKL